MDPFVSGRPAGAGVEAFPLLPPAAVVVPACVPPMLPDAPPVDPGLPCAKEDVESPIRPAVRTKVRIFIVTPIIIRSERSYSPEGSFVRLTSAMLLEACAPTPHAPPRDRASRHPLDRNRKAIWG
jgi:hypothetical protein